MSAAPDQTAPADGAAAETAVTFRKAKYPKYTHFWKRQNVLIKSFARAEYTTTGFHQHSHGSFRVTFKLLFQMLALSFEIPELDDDDESVVVLARVTGRNVCFFSPQCKDIVQEGVYYIFQHDADECEDDICFHTSEWNAGKIRHAFDLSTWAEDEDCLPSCCKSVFLNVTPLKKEDPRRKKDGASLKGPTDTEEKEDEDAPAEDPKEPTGRGRSRTAAGRGRSRAAAKKPAASKPRTTQAGPTTRARASTVAVKKGNDMEARLLTALHDMETRIREDVRGQIAEVEERLDNRIDRLDNRISGVQTQVSLITHHLIEEQYECTQEELDRCNSLGTQGIILTTRTPAFRTQVEARQAQCLLSGARNHPDDLTRLDGELTGPGIEAAHIVPLGRPDLWSEAMVSAVRASRSERVLRNAPYVDNNCVENGVMLRADLHKMFDRFFWSVHPTTRVVVVFVPIPEMMEYHGMKVDRKPRGFPPAKIWQWHWEQCVIRCLRAAAEGNPEDKYYDNEPEVKAVSTVTKQMAELVITGPGTDTGVTIDKAIVDGPQVPDTAESEDDTDMAMDTSDSSDSDSTASSRPPSPEVDASAVPAAAYVMPTLSERCKADLRAAVSNNRYVF